MNLRLRRLNACPRSVSPHADCEGASQPFGSKSRPKVIPHQATLAGIYRYAVEAEQAKEAVESALKNMKKAGAVKITGGLDKKVKAHLKSNPAMTWDKAVVEIARQNLRAARPPEKRLSPKNQERRRRAPPR
jgi:hypothetical protein